MPLVAAAQITDRIAEILQLIAALHAAEDADGRARTLEWDALYREREILQAALNADTSTVAVREPCLGLSEQFAMPFETPFPLLVNNCDGSHSSGGQHPVCPERGQRRADWVSHRATGSKP